MYIYDCLYGKMEFNKKVIRCILTPEMQRLREVRLGNINSLFLTGSANINRFEHSVGTAYLATINENANKKAFSKLEKEAFVFAALFHDLANGPFGHSYEYIAEKQGFIPEKGLADVLLGRRSGAHGKVAKYEPFFLGESNEIGTILDKEEILLIDEIVRGDNEVCSKVLSDIIDIDNIDNVYRMAYHMGIEIDRKIPIELSKGIICKKNKIYFKETVVPYIYDWYDVRSKVYTLLLYNTEDFAAKCMLSEVIDLVMEKDPLSIKWYYTDNQLISVLRSMDESWEDKYCIVGENDKIGLEPINDSRTCDQYIRDVLKAFDVTIPENANITYDICGEKIYVSFYNTYYYICKNRLYKKERLCIDPSNIITRLMRGDLYDCIGIFITSQIDKKHLLLDKNERRKIEDECNYLVEKNVGIRLKIGIHAIVDQNKTNRKVEVSLETGECFSIGKNTNLILIGVFIKNAQFGLAQKKKLSKQKKETVRSLLINYFLSIGIGVTNHPLYTEADAIE